MCATLRHRRRHHRWRSRATSPIASKNCPARLLGPMERLDTRLEGPILLKPKVFGDERGFFVETYRRSTFSDLGIAEEMRQDNHSRSSAKIVRGMHFQIGEGTSKLVRCGRGAIWD